MTEVSTVIGVHDVPQAVRTLTSLGEPDYIDLFTITTATATASATATAPATATAGSAEEWARAILEQAPLARAKARALWRLIGLRLGPRGSPDHVQGWRIDARGDGWLRLETASWYLTAQAICLVEDAQVSLSLSLRYDRPIAKLVWAAVAGPHQRAVPVMLHQAAKLMSG